MVEVSQAFREAVVADSRRTVAKAVVEIISPDIVYGAVADSGAAATALPEQLRDKVMISSYPYATLEVNRWALDGSMHILDLGHVQGDQGWHSASVSGADGVFSSDPWVELQFTGVTILQACSIVFGDGVLDGIPTDFTVAVMSGAAAAWSKTITSNTQRTVSLSGFTVNKPTGIRVTVHATSLPYRRVRVTEIIAGIYEEWTNDDLVSISLKQQGDPSCASLPYGTLSLTMDNSTRRFDPGAKAGVFQSLEDRQGIKMYLGVRLSGGVDELAPVGIYYQFQGGWRTGANDLSMTWNLVDIIGLLAARPFAAPATLPTTLGGWVAAIVGQLGVNFAARATVDPAIAGTALTVNAPEDVDKMRCGDLLRFACMVAGAWPRADNATGNLLVEPMQTGGGSVTLDNLSSYPSIQANNDVASIAVTIYNGTSPLPVVTVPGNQPSSSLSLSIQNPFIHTEAAARSAAALILSAYGGNRIVTSGRGDPSAEIGDLDSVEINRQQSVQGRRIYQTLNIQNGIMSSCQSTFLAPDLTAATPAQPQILLSSGPSRAAARRAAAQPSPGYYPKAARAGSAESIIDTLITDRTQTDVDRVYALSKLGIAGMTAAELAEYIAGLKGAYNASDLNRVQAAMEYSADRLREYGYSVTLQPAPEWTRNDIPPQEQMAIYLDNLATLRGVLTVPQTTPEGPTDMEDLMWQDANDIERILADIDRLLDNMAAAWRHCGAAVCGGGGLLIR